MHCCVGIMAHDEGANITDALHSLLSQKGPHVEEFDVLVVASGCTDDTVERTREVMRTDPRVRLLEQRDREGKAAAVTAFIRQEADTADVLVLAGGDTRLEPGALEALVAPFDDPTIGMTGGRPVPVNRRDRTLGRVVHLLWNLHHEVAMEDPKLGELVAFRPVFPSIPSDTAVDEAAIESLILSGGLRIAYAPGARVRMRGPETIADYLAQRRRIHAGHRHLKRSSGHEVSTMSLRRILSAARRSRRGTDRWFRTLLSAAVLEATARWLGTWDEKIVRRDHSTWKRISSTKDLSS